MRPDRVDLASSALSLDRMVIRVAAEPAGLAVVARNRHAWPFRFGTGSAVHELVEALDCPLAIVDIAEPAWPAVPDRPAAVAVAGV